MTKSAARVLFVSGVFSAGALGLSAGFSSSATAADEAGKCKLATKGDSEVAKACAEGGIKKAKAVMKDMLKRGKAAGVKHDCDDCHKEDDMSQLTPDGGEKFKKLVAAIAKK